MKKVEFVKNDEAYDVRIINPENKYDWEKYGELVFDDDQEAWVLWTGTSYSDGKLAHTSDDGVTYEESLEETKQEIVDELN